MIAAQSPSARYSPRVEERRQRRKTNRSRTHPAFRKTGDRQGTMRLLRSVLLAPAHTDFRLAPAHYSGFHRVPERTWMGRPVPTPRPVSVSSAETSLLRHRATQHWRVSSVRSSSPGPDGYSANYDARDDEEYEKNKIRPRSHAGFYAREYGGVYQRATQSPIHLPKRPQSASPRTRARGRPFSGRRTRSSSHEFGPPRSAESRSRSSRESSERYSLRSKAAERPRSHDTDTKRRLSLNSSSSEDSSSDDSTDVDDDADSQTSAPPSPHQSPRRPTKQRQRRCTSRKACTKKHCSRGLGACVRSPPGQSPSSFPTLYSYAVPSLILSQYAGL